MFSTNDGTTFTYRPEICANSSTPFYIDICDYNINPDIDVAAFLCKDAFDNQTNIGRYTVYNT